MTLFTILVFCSVAVFIYALSLTLSGHTQKKRHKVILKLASLNTEIQPEYSVSLLKHQYHAKVSRLDVLLHNKPGIAALEKLIGRAGHRYPAYRVVLFIILLTVLAAFITWLASGQVLLTLAISLIVPLLPLLKLKMDEKRRIQDFEAQLPDALDIMIRALRTGYPFTETLSVIASEMVNPIAEELGTCFDEINHGQDIRQALSNLSDRVPCLTLTAIGTAIMIQRETGGNLAETLEKISKLIRSRFRFQRRLKTLSAEGRLSAWILGLLPFVLFGLISMTTPGYAQTLLLEPVGKNLLTGALVLLAIGNLWIIKLLKIES